jgi:predicted DNA-binding transcriptional regulator YafY
MANDSQKIQQLRRILILYQLVKTKPEMSSKALQEELGVGKSTYNRDRKFMERLGIKFSYSKAKRRQLITKTLLPAIPRPQPDERLAIFLALSQLGDAGILSRKTRQGSGIQTSGQPGRRFLQRPAMLSLTRSRA